MDDFAIVTLDGGSYSGDWYISKNLVQYLSSDLSNSGSSTIYLYRDISSSSSYNREYIQISSLSTAIYHPASGNSVSISGVSVVDYNFVSQVYKNSYLFDPVLILLLGLSIVVRLLKHD